MISTSQLKLIKSLSQKKYRKIHQLFLAEGVKVVEELLSSSLSIHSLYATPQWLNQNIGKARKIRIANINEINDLTLKSISSLENPNQVLAIAEIPKLKDIIPSGFDLAVESIRDPGNLGTIIRIADWYGLPQLLCSEDCVDAYNPKVIQASMGSIFRVSVHYLDLNAFIKTNIEIHSYAASLNGKSLNEVQIEFPSLLVIGNESKGISPDIEQSVSECIAIARYGHAESLNAAVATGILTDYFKRVKNI